MVRKNIVPLALWLRCSSIHFPDISSHSLCTGIYSSARQNQTQYNKQISTSRTDVTLLSDGVYVAVGHLYRVPRGWDSFLMQIHSQHAIDRQWKPISSHKCRFISRLRPSALNTVFVLSLTQRRAQGPEWTRERKAKSPNGCNRKPAALRWRNSTTSSATWWTDSIVTEKRKERRNFTERASLIPPFKDCSGGEYFYIKKLLISKDMFCSEAMLLTCLMNANRFFLTIHSTICVRCLFLDHLLIELIWLRK